MKFKTKIIIGISVIGLALSGLAATTIGVLPASGVGVIDSTATTNTVVNFPAWPISIVSAQTVTNFTAINIMPYKEVALEFSCQGTNTASTSNIVWSVYASVKGAIPANAQFTNSTGVVQQDMVLLGTVTNVLNATPTRVTTIAAYGPITNAASTYQSSDVGIRGISTLYIGTVTVPALTGITNYQVYFSGK
jgi:hypothetical protein